MRRFGFRDTWYRSETWAWIDTLPVAFVSPAKIPTRRPGYMNRTPLMPSTSVKKASFEQSHAACPRKREEKK
jgi:hypothetical protein